MRKQLQFERYLGCRVDIRMDDGRVFVGNLEDEDWQFLHLTDCLIKLPRKRNVTKAPNAVVRKLFIQTLIVYECARGEENGERLLHH